MVENMKPQCKGLMISAPKKSSGKTTLTLGISQALVQKGKILRVFKKGPDYIDPMWHKAATGKNCYNIDPYWMDSTLCKKRFLTWSQGVDISIVEGNHGLHDSMDLEGQNSGAFLSKLLNIPVLLVVDGSGMNRGVAAIVLGQQNLDPEVKIGGVILNNVANQRQAGKQVAAIEHYCDIPVVGALPRSLDIGIKERHLGLVTIHENPDVQDILHKLAKTVNENCDLDKILSIAGDIQLPSIDIGLFAKPVASKVRIGVAYDKAFCFYYPDNLQALREAGAELVFFDTLNDCSLPEMDGLYLGGGFPESFLNELENNRNIRSALHEKIERGLPVYAECGGLMYLTRSITRNGIKREMVGAIPADVLFQKKPVGKGYAELTTMQADGWFKTDRLIKGHEFHYSRLSNLEAGIKYNYTIQRGTGIDGKHDGIIHHNILAAYTHIHSTVVPEWAPGFVETVYQLKCMSTPPS